MNRNAAPPVPPASLRIGFIGAGKVGFSMGKFFAQGGLDVSGYYSRSVESAREAAAFTNSACFQTLPEIVASSDALFITVPDGAIADVYRQLREYDLAGKQICHCSGSLSAAEVFPDLAQAGATGYSLHPLFPVSSKMESYKELPGAFFCIEGSAQHLEEWKQRIEALGPTVQVIPSEAKKRYHAACVMPSNLVCALVQQSLDMLVSCGFSEDMALSAITPLVRANMDHIIEHGPVEALTGPIERNDVATVEAHLRCFESATERELYQAVSRKLVEVAQRRHPDADYTRMLETLNA